MGKLEFRDYELIIELTPFINIIGMPNSGKTMLLRTLINNVYNPHIYLDGIALPTMDLAFKRKNLAACLDLNFKTTVVKEELLFYQEKCGIDNTIAFDNIDKFAAFFALEGIIEQKIAQLSIYERALIKILSLLIIKPKIMGIDNLFAYLDRTNQQKIMKFAKEQKITILNVTSHSEDLLLGTDIIILENHRVKAYNKTQTILANESLLVAAGFTLPFVVGLSKGLNYYEVCDKNYDNLKALVEALWP